VLPEIPGDDVRTLTTTCHLRVSERAVLKALREGASQVVFAGCVEATCRFPYARPIVLKRMRQIQATLAELGMEDSLVVTGGADEEELAHL
jgi:coenzyme F420-reducing hydrogenase delta subunit